MHIMVVPSWYSSKDNPVHGSFFKEQFLALQRSGEKVTVAYNEIWPITTIGRKKEKSGFLVEKEDGLKTYRYKGYNFLPKNPLMFKIFNKRMEKLYLEIVKKEGKVDIIHAHSSFWGAISAAYVSKKYNIPLIITEHTSMAHSKYVKDSYIPHVKNAYDSSDVVIAVSKALKKEMEQYTTNKIVVINNMIDLNYIPKISKKEKSNNFNFFALGYLVEGKGYELLLEAFKEIVKENKNVILRIGAEGYLKDSLISYVNSNGLEENVKFLGYMSREDVGKEMSKANAFVLPSEYETFGMVYIEALASGTPVIGAKNGGAEEIINDSNGIMINVGAKDELVDAMKYMIENADKYSGEELRKYCINKFNEEKIITEIKEQYIKVLKGEI